MGIIFLGRCLDRCSNHERVYGRVYRSYYPSCTHAYIISSKLIKDIIDDYTYTEPIDSYLRSYAQKYEFYAFHPSIIVQDVLTYVSSLRSVGDSLNTIQECADNMKSDNSNQILSPFIAIILLMVIIILIISYGY